MFSLTPTKKHAKAKAIFENREKVGSASTLQKAQDVAFADFTDRVSEHIR